MIERDLSRLSYLAASLVACPKHYKELIGVIRKKPNLSPELTEALDKILEYLDTGISISETSKQLITNNSYPSPAWYAGQILFAALRMNDRI